ncbi:hypothetical protein KL918_005410 [Ogataea parapolymorpha]|nr:hypothetical protein KL918_005410 [Ogataea parapolymorpha]KAG7865879.1 hypothetical protein KL916_005443 [Ogataea parapolymorpha]
MSLGPQAQANLEQKTSAKRWCPSGGSVPKKVVSHRRVSQQKGGVLVAGQTAKSWCLIGVLVSKKLVSHRRVSQQKAGVLVAGQYPKSWCPSGGSVPKKLVSHRRVSQQKAGVLVAGLHGGCGISTSSGRGAENGCRGVQRVQWSI